MKSTINSGPTTQVRRSRPDDSCVGDEGGCFAARQTDEFAGFKIAKTALPMFLIMVLMVMILILWPELATWLPETARRAPGG